MWILMIGPLSHPTERKNLGMPKPESGCRMTHNIQPSPAVQLRSTTPCGVGP